MPEAGGSLTGLAGKLIWSPEPGWVLDRALRWNLPDRAQTSLCTITPIPWRERSAGVPDRGAGTADGDCGGRLSQVADCQRVVESAAAGLGGLDGLVNNAGIVATRPFEESDDALFDRVYGVMEALLCTSRLALCSGTRGSCASGYQNWAGGSVVNISSVHGQAGFSGHSVYAGTKGAVNAWTRACGGAVHGARACERDRTWFNRGALVLGGRTQTIVVSRRTARYLGGAWGYLLT